MLHRSFATVNSPVVFDDTVTKEYLETVKQAFLCGLFISENTLADVSSLVKKKGLVVISSPRFAPEKFVAEHTSGTKEFKVGQGKWIITDNMAGDELKKIVKTFIGKGNEIVYTFKGNR